MACIGYFFHVVFLFALHVVIAYAQDAGDECHSGGDLSLGRDIKPNTRNLVFRGIKINCEGDIIGWRYYVNMQMNNKINDTVEATIWRQVYRSYYRLIGRSTLSTSNPNNGTRMRNSPSEIIIHVKPGDYVGVHYTRSDTSYKISTDKNCSRQGKERCSLQYITRDIDTGHVQNLKPGRSDIRVTMAALKPIVQVSRHSHGCVGEWITLACPPGFSVNIALARYGRPNDKTDRCYFVQGDQWIDGATSLQGQCDEQKSNTCFIDLRHFANSTRKSNITYLTVSYQCLSATEMVTSPTDSWGTVSSTTERKNSSISVPDRNALIGVSVITLFLLFIVVLLVVLLCRKVSINPPCGSSEDDKKKLSNSSQSERDGEAAASSNDDSRVHRPQSRHIYDRIASIKRGFTKRRNGKLRNAEASHPTESKYRNDLHGESDLDAENAYDYTYIPNIPKVKKRADEKSTEILMSGLAGIGCNDDDSHRHLSLKADGPINKDHDRSFEVDGPDDKDDDSHRYLSLKADGPINKDHDRSFEVDGPDDKDDDSHRYLTLTADGPINKDHDRSFEVDGPDDKDDDSHRYLTLTADGPLELPSLSVGDMGCPQKGQNESDITINDFYSSD